MTREESKTVLTMLTHTVRLVIHHITQLGLYADPRKRSLVALVVNTVVSLRRHGSCPLSLIDLSQTVKSCPMHTQMIAYQFCNTCECLSGYSICVSVGK